MAFDGAGKNQSIGSIKTSHNQLDQMIRSGSPDRAHHPDRRRLAMMNHMTMELQAEAGSALPPEREEESNLIILKRTSLICLVLL